MANSINNLSYTRRLCKYYIVTDPKSHRKIIYNQGRKDLQKMIRTLCKNKKIKIIEGHVMPAVHICF